MSFETRTPRRQNTVNLVLGAVMIVAVLVAAFMLYQKELKPRMTAAEQQVEQYFTFQVTCDIKVPIKATYQPWDRVWVYLIPCVMPPGTEVVPVSNGVGNLYPLPKPGLHFITVADSAPVGLFDWTHYWEQVRGVDINTAEGAQQATQLKWWDFHGMQVYELYPKENLSVATLSFVCHEELDEERMTVSYVCNSD